MPILFLVLSIPALWSTANALRPPARRGVGPLWFPALIVGELALFHATIQAAVLAAAVWTGAADGWAGRIALVSMGLSIVGLLAVQGYGLTARREIERAAATVLEEEVRLPRLRLGALARPFPRSPADVAVDTLQYGPDRAHVLDRYRALRLAGDAPVLIQVHGGGWTGGRRAQQARELKHRMARSGWVVFDVDYRMSPRATFPDHLIDVKRAVAWVRRDAADHGVDPSFIAVTGGSAGGQLAALAALVDDPSLQPGFATADTTVQACIPFYGVHDLLDASGSPLWPYLASHVLKVEPGDDPGLWDLASPARRRIGAGHPPFLVFHGGHDGLVRAGHSRRLVDRLRSAGGAPAGYAELPGATHGFDAIRSVRTVRAVDAIQIVLERLLERHRAARRG